MLYAIKYFSSNMNNIQTDLHDQLTDPHMFYLSG